MIDPVPEGDRPAAPTLVQPETPGLKAVRGESVAATVGSFMAGIEQAVFQRRPPGVELIQEHAHSRGTNADGLEVTIDIPPLHPKR